MKGELSRWDLERLLARNLFKDMEEPYDMEDIGRIIKNEICTLPESYSVDPRTGTVVIYVPGRAKRPHDNGHYKNEKDQEKKTCNIKTCPIDRGDTTPIIMHKPLPSGSYAFINENMFPFIIPDGIPDVLVTGKRLKGFHLLVWPTTKHEDIHEMDYKDHAVTFELLGDLERQLKEEQGFSDWHFQVIKNTGAAVGGSLEHGHYQASFTNWMPKRIIEDKNFLDIQGISFVGHLIESNPQDLLIKSYGSFDAVIPYCMRRPLDAVIYPKDKRISNIADMEPSHRIDLAKALCELTSALSVMMPGMEKEFAYNLVFHTGLVGTMYIEVLPYTQQEGGFERAGLNVCQSTPKMSAQMYKDSL